MTTELKNIITKVKYSLPEFTIYFLPYGMTEYSYIQFPWENTYEIIDRFINRSCTEESEYYIYLGTTLLVTAKVASDEPGVVTHSRLPYALEHYGHQEVVAKLRSGDY